MSPTSTLDARTPAALFPTRRPTPMAALLAAVLAAAGTVARRIAAVLTVAAHRRDVRTMLDLDDRCLRDIGLLRNDVLGALAHPLLDDPSTVLMMRSVERRSRARLLADAVSRVPGSR